MLTKEHNDHIHQLIVDRLTERNRKMKFIRNREKSDRKHVFQVISLALAACMAGVFFFISTERTTESSITPIRSGTVDVQRLIEDDKYEEALHLVERELMIADSVLKSLNEEKSCDEETMYEIKTQELRVDELNQELDALKKKLKN